MNLIGAFDKINNPVTDSNNITKTYSFGQIEGDHEYYSQDQFSVILSGKIYDWQSKRENNSASENSASRLLKQMVIKGIDSVSSLDGQFISIIDTPRYTYIFRDYIGNGSQVYYNDILFSNSLRLIKESGMISFEPDILSISNFLKEGYISAPSTAIKGLKKLSPGEYLVYRKSIKTLFVRNVISQQDFNEKAGTSKISLQEAVSDYEELHRNSVRKRINGNEEVGVLLSGGYDSGGNLSALRDIFHGKINAYSVGFDDERWSELPLANIMATKFEANHEIHILKGSDIEALPKIVNQLGDPFFENGLMLNYKISEAMSHTTPNVVLGGDGNDQIFGTSGRELALLSLSKKFKLNHIQKLIEPLTEKSSRLFRLGFHNKNILQALQLKHFGFSDSELIKMLNKEADHSSITKNGESDTKRLEDYNSLYYLRNYNTDIIESAAQVISFKASQLAKMYKLNVTFPYLDKDIFTYLAALPRELKMKGSVKELAMGKGQSKYLFKEYLRNKLPEEITNRKKQGGFAPLSIFMNDKNIRNRMYAFIERTFSDTGLFKPGAIRLFMASVEATIENPDDWFWYKQTKYASLFHLLVLAIWWQQFIFNKVRPTLSDYLND